jgi:mannosyltransferase
MTAAIAVWLTVVLVIAATRRGSALWALYSLALALAVVSFVYVGLLVFAHAVTLAFGRTRRALVPFAIAVAAALGLASPLIALTATQRQQVAWIGTAGNGYATGVLAEQWFTYSRLFMCACVILLAWGSVQLVTRKAGGPGCALAVALPWIVMPTVLLVAYSIFVRDVYQPRYLTYTTPGLALLLAVCARAVARERLRLLAVLLAVLAASSSTAFVTQREPYAKPGGADYSAIADLIEANSRPQDCIAFAIASGIGGPEPLRASAAARPAAFAHLDDVAAGISGADAAQLWSEDLPLDSDIVRPRLAGCSVLWLVIDRATPSPLMDSAKRQGFGVDREWNLHRSLVARLVKT